MSLRLDTGPDVQLRVPLLSKNASHLFTSSYASVRKCWGSQKPNAAGSHAFLPLQTLLCLCLMLALPTTCVWFEPDELTSSSLTWGFLLFSRFIYMFHVSVQFMVSCDWMFLLKLWKWLCTLNALAVNGGDSGQNKVMLLMIRCCLCPLSH